MFVSHTSDASQLPSWDCRPLYDCCIDNMLSTSTCLPWPYISWITALTAGTGKVSGLHATPYCVCYASLTLDIRETQLDASRQWDKTVTRRVMRVPALEPGSFLLVALLLFVLIGKEMLVTIRRPALLNVIPHTGKCICHGEGLTVGGCAFCWRLFSINIKLFL